MKDSLELTTDVIAGATALGGLLLVFLGNVLSSYGSFEKTAQSAVRARHQVRAWLATVGVIVALLSAGLALVAKWFNNACAANVSIVLLLIALVWGCVAAVLSAKDVS